MEYAGTYYSRELDTVYRLLVDDGKLVIMHRRYGTSVVTPCERDVFSARAAWLGIRRQPQGELEVVGGRLRSGQSCGTNPLITLLQNSWR